MNIKLITFPRSGSHYLRELLQQKTGFDLRGTHNHKIKADFIITIVRNPLDCFISSIKMGEHYYGVKDSPVREKDGFVIMKQYCDFHDYLAEHAHIVIDYRDLIDKPDEVINVLAKKLGLTVNNNEYKTELKDIKEIRYLVSSKNVPMEKDHYVYSYDLTKPLLSYEKILEKKLKI